MRFTSCNARNQPAIYAGWPAPSFYRFITNKGAPSFHSFIVEGWETTSSSKPLRSLQRERNTVTPGANLESNQQNDAKAVSTGERTLLLTCRIADSLTR